MANEFNILTGVTINTKPAQKEYEVWKKGLEKNGLNLKFNIDTKSLTSVNNELKKINTTTLSTANGFENVSNALAKAQENMNNMARYSEKLETAKMNNSLREMSKVLGDINAPVKETSTTFEKWEDAQGKIITQTRNFDSELGTIITKVEQYKNTLGQTVTETTTFNDNWDKLSHNMEVVDDRIARATEEEKKLAEAEKLASTEAKTNAKATESMGNAMSKASTNTESLASKIVTAAGKVALFKVSTTIVMGFYNAIGEAKDAIMDFDTALTEFKKVSDLSGEALDDYTEKLGELGEAVARSREQMVNAATEFKKSGFSNEQSAELAQIASLYQNVADSELSAGDSASYIISQMKAFGMTTTAEAQSIIDKTNEVANSYAVSSTDISQALTKTSSAMAAYGNTIDESIALTTAGAEILNGNVGKVAKGLRSIGANVTNLAAASDSMQISVDGSLKTIQLIDETTGDMLSTYDVLAQISQYWDDMNSSEQSQLALTLANKTQFEVFTSVLSNFTTAEDALTTSLNSQGSAWKENEAFLQSNEASINSIKASFQELILNSQLDEFVKLVLQATAGLMKFANSGLGQVVIKMTLTAVALNQLLKLYDKAWEKTIPKLITTFANLGTGLDSLSAKEVITTLTTEGLSAALMALNINPVILAITAIVGLATALKAADDKAQESFESIDSEIETLKSESEQAEESIKDLTEKLKQLNEEKLSITDPEELTQLEAQSAELENQLRLQYELIEANKERIKQDYEDKIGTNRNEYTHYRVTSDGTNKVAEVKQSKGETDLNTVLKEQSNNVNVLTTSLEGLIEKRNALNVTEAEYQNYLETGKGLSSETASAYERLNESISNVSNDLSLAKGEFSETVDYMKQAQEAGVKLSESSQQIVDGYDEQISASEDATMTIEEVADKYGVTVEAINAYMEANEECTSYSEAAINVMAEQAEQADDENTSLQDLSSTLTTLASDYQSLQSAVDDYNNGGTMSLETLDALINAATNYSGCLELQNGKLVLSEQYFEDLAQQKIANAKADLVMETRTKLATLAEQTQGEVISQTSRVIDTSKASVDDIRVSLQNMAGDAITAAQAWNVLKSSMSNEDAGNLEYQQKINEIRDEFTVQWKTLDEIGSQISGNFDGYASSIAKSSGSAAKSSEDAWLKAYKAEKEAIDAMYENGTLSAEQYQEKLLELQAKYLTDTKEHQEKYASEIKSLYEDIYKALKDSVKDSLDEMKDAHDKAEDALKKQHEAQEKSIKNQIELLKRQKEAVEDSYDAQIEALKREREEYENQLELMKLKESLAKAQQQYQYVMNENGRFEWTQDQNAVDEAQEELYEEQLKQAYEKQLQDLEDAKDAAIALYEQQIQDLEDYYDQVQEANDEAEEALEAHNEAIEEQYEKAIEDFDLYAEMLNNGQLAQIESENANWATRLTNLAQFVNSYNAMLAELGNEGATVSPSASFSGGSSSKSSSKKSSSTSGSKTTYSMKKGKVLDVKKHASGVSSISDDELALVGDSPNQELVIGSKLNGIPLTLSSGSGVVNAKSTKSLAGLLNSIPNLGNNYNTTNNNSQHSIHIDTINLPQVQNGSDFVDYLQNFNVDMTANAYRFGS